MGLPMSIVTVTSKGRKFIDGREVNTNTWTPDQPSRGFGDTIAKMTSAVGIKPCGGCKKRQAALNKAVPYKRGK